MRVCPVVRLVLMVLAATLLAAGRAHAAPAAPKGAEPAPTPGAIQVRINGAPATFEVPPMEKDGHVVVPMEDIFHRLGAVANYDGVTRTVKAWKGRTIILVRVGSDTAYVNTKPHHLDAPAFPMNGKVMVPLRFVGETLDAKVSWDAKARVVSIVTRAPPSTVAVTPPAGPATPQATGGQATPAPAEPPAPADTAPPAIREFYHNATGPLKPGDTLLVTLIGTPGGHAAFFVQGVVEDVPMKEISPGTYSGEYKFAAGAAVRGAQVFGTLQVGAAPAPLATAATLVSVEPPHPHLVQMEPAPNSSTSVSTPRIAAFFETAGGTLDAHSVTVRVNGVDVTAKAYVNGKFFTYAPDRPLPAGKVHIDVSGTVANQQPLQDGWEFEVQSGASVGSATHGSQAIYDKGELLNVTMVGTSGGKATFDIGSYRVGLPMREASTPGTYVGQYRVGTADRVDDQPVIVHLQVAGYPTATAQAPIPVTLGRGPVPSSEVPLTVTTPSNQAAVGGQIEVTGRTAARAKVTVSLAKRVPLTDRDFELTHQDVTADAYGNFKATLRSIAVLPGLHYDLVVTALEPGGKMAVPVKIAVVGK